MQNYSTIVGIIEFRLEGRSYEVVQKRYSVGSGTVTKMMDRYKEIGLSLEDLRRMEPKNVEDLFYPRANLQRKEVPMPDYQAYYDRLMSKGSKCNLSYLWLEYKQENPNGYQATQFYEHFNRFVRENYGSTKVSMPVERIPGEKMYIDWIGDKPALLVDVSTGDLLKVCVFATTLGVSSLVYAEVFANEKLPSFIAGTVNALRFYNGVPKYLVPDNCPTAVKKHSKDELVLNSAYQDLEDFYDTIILPTPPRKPKGKATIESHVRFLETHLIEKLKEGVYTSLESMNDDVRKIVVDINKRGFQKKTFSRQELYERYDRPHMKPLPGENYTTCDYKYFLRIPDNYHLEYDNHYYSVLYTHHGQPAIVKATLTEIRICDRNNRLICKHTRSYKDYPLYITEDDHMKPEHLYYKELNARDGAYYRRWASVYGDFTFELIDTILRSARHEEQAYKSCSGILHSCKGISHGLVEETSRQCIEMQLCKYTYFKKVLNTVAEKKGSVPRVNAVALPVHDNIRGKDFYK